MLHKFFEPFFSHDDLLLLICLTSDLHSVLLSYINDFLKIVRLDTPDYSEEEFTLRILLGVHLECREVLAYIWTPHCIFVHVLYRELRELWDFDDPHMRLMDRFLLS
jgi:hypothetical protein